MKIAVNTRFLLEEKLEGIGWFTYETMKRLTCQHPEHEFIFLFDRSYSEKFIFSDNITPEVVSPPARHPLLWYYWFEWAVPKVLDKHQPDLLISPDGYLSLNTDVPTLLVIHDLAFEHYPKDLPFLTRKYYRHYTEKFAHRADHIATVSEFSKNDIVNQYRVSEEKVSVVYDGAHESFSPLDEEAKDRARQEFADGEEYMIYVGALHPRKNISNLLQAFDRFKIETGSPTRFVIAGNPGWKTGRMERIYRQMEHRETVRFTGHLGRDQLRYAMGGAKGFVYVSRFEGFGIPVLEAMYCDVPVITSDRTSMPEIAGEAALQVNPFSVKEINKALVRLDESEDLRQELIQRGQQQRQQFTWERTADRLWSIVEELLPKAKQSKTASFVN